VGELALVRWRSRLRCGFVVTGKTEFTKGPQAMNLRPFFIHNGLRDSGCDN
jgi:hypothetical protein